MPFFFLKEVDEGSSALSLLKRIKLNGRVMRAVSVSRFPLSPLHKMSQL